MMQSSDRQEIILFESKWNEQPFKCQATITDGAINFKFNDAKICMQFYWKERETNQDTKYFQRLNSFTEFHRQLTMEQLKQNFLAKLKSLGVKDWTTKMAERTERIIKEKQKNG